MEKEALRKFIFENGNLVNVEMIANKFYPNSVSIDTEGRNFNRATSVVARVLRQKRWMVRNVERSALLMSPDGIRELKILFIFVVLFALFSEL